MSHLMNEITDRMEDAVRECLEWATYEEVCEIANHDPKDPLEQYAQSVAEGIKEMLDEMAEEAEG